MLRLISVLNQYVSRETLKNAAKPCKNKKISSSDCLNRYYILFKKMYFKQ